MNIKIIVTAINFILSCILVASLQLDRRSFRRKGD